MALDWVPIVVIGLIKAEMSKVDNYSISVRPATCILNESGMS